jgi:hypothetical protein
LALVSVTVIALIISDWPVLFIAWNTVLTVSPAFPFRTTLVPENMVAEPVGVDVGLPVGVGLPVAVGVPLGVAVGSVAFHLQMTPLAPAPSGARLQLQLSGVGLAIANIAFFWFTSMSQPPQGFPGVQASGPW